ncbi:hypothetical protein B5P43_12270 [Bacillus sp. SRB_336]|nr:hypothetical protein B5P43_12270 [Bacillus sp. SRB_336]
MKLASKRISAVATSRPEIQPTNFQFIVNEGLVGRRDLHLSIFLTVAAREHDACTELMWAFA